MARNSGRFHFDGGAATFVGTAILGVLITSITFGICYPFALVLNERWRAKHSYIDGRRLVFTGSATGLFGHWVKWLLLSFITVGVYLFWVGPRIARWKWEHTDFDPMWNGAGIPVQPGAVAIDPSSAGPALPIAPAPGFAPQAGQHV